MDLATVIGLVLALGAVLGGFVLEGGHVGPGEFDFDGRADI